MFKCLPLVLLLLSTSVAADDSKWYIGLGLGKANPQLELDEHIGGVSVTLPDDEVIDMLLSKGIVVLRTDLHDNNCPVDNKVGRESQHGGCTNYVLEW